MSPILVLLIAVALIYGFFNGFHDSSNIVATMISSRSVQPRKALIITAIGEFLGPFLFGVAVAKTIGSEVVTPGAVNITVIYATLVTAILWNLLTWYVGIPSSSSHALIGGIIGATAAQVGFGVIHITGVEKIILFLFLSPVIGLTVGYLVMRVVLAYLMTTCASPRVNWLFKRAQVLTALSLALSHGANDGQKTIGIITMALVSFGFLSTFSVPVWVVALSGGAISLGTLVGGWRLIKTLGGKIYRIRPIHAFSSQVASTIVIFAAGILGGPVSTSQVVATSIMGVGAAEATNKVRWNVAQDIAWTWILTIPASFCIAALLSRGFVAIGPLIQRLVP